MTPALPDAFFVDSFISALKPQLKPFVKALNPDSLQAAITFARLQEKALKAWKQTATISQQTTPFAYPKTYIITSFFQAAIYYQFK